MPFLSLKGPNVVTTVELNWLNQGPNNEIVKAHFNDKHEGKTNCETALHVINMFTGNFPI